MSKNLLRISMLGLFLAVAGAGAASAATTVNDDSWADSAKITPSGASSTDSSTDANNTLVPDSYEFWKD